MYQNNHVITTDSKDIGVYLVLLFYIISIPVLPMAVFGWYIGEFIIQNNFAKWMLPILFYGLTYALIIYIKNHKGLRYAFLFVIVEYFVFDVVITLRSGADELMILSIIKKIMVWGLSNS